MQKNYPELPLTQTKKTNSQSFGTDRPSSLLSQFVLKTKEVLIDDFRARKVYESVKPVSHTYKTELKQFIKNFSTKPKDQFIELCNHLIEKFVDLANLKIYLWYFREGKQMGTWQDAHLFSGLLDSFSHSILSEESQKELNKSMQTEETRSKKPSVVFSQSSDTFEDLNFSPIKLPLRRLESLPEQIEAQILQGSKESKDILKPLDKLFESLSKGDFEQAAKQKFPVSTTSKLKEKKEKFLEKCQIIKRVIEHLNTQISSSDRVKPQISLKSLQKCMEKVIKASNKAKKGQKMTGSGTYLEKESTLQSEQKQNLQKALSQAQKLFNDKSMELSLQKMKLGKEISELNAKLSKVNEQNSELMEEVSQLKARLQKKQKQIFKMREEYFAKLRQKSLEYQTNAKEEIRKEIEKKTQIIDDLKNQIEESTNSSNLKEKNEDQNIKRLNRLIETLRTQNHKLKSCQNIQEKKILELEQENLRLSQNLNLKQTQTVSNVSSLSSKLSLLEQKENILKNQNKDIEQKYAKLSLSFNELNNKFETQQKMYKKLVSKSLEMVRLNSLLESSDILPPFSLASINQKLLKSSQLMSEENVDKRREIFYDKRLGSLVQKQFLLEQIQNYVCRIQAESKVKAFKLIYRLHHDIKTNFHEYIDEKPCFLVLIKLKSGAIVGGYSHQALKKGLRTQLGFIFSLSLLESFFLKEKHCVVYDEYYLIFGNSQIRIRIGENLFYSNFGITKSSFQVNNRDFTDFLMTQNDREQVMEYFEIYQVSFDSE